MLSLTLLNRDSVPPGNNRFTQSRALGHGFGPDEVPNSHFKKENL